MPSKRFLKLGDEKKQRIMESAMDEFIDSGIHDASINKIIKNADISRGSFYTYFSDKRELFEYIFEQMKKASSGIILDEVKKQNGDIFKAAKALVLLGIDVPVSEKTKTSILYDRIMTDFDIISHLNEINFGSPGNVFSDMLYAIYEKMNDLRNCLSKKEFYILGDLMVVMSIKALVAVKRNPELKEEILKVLYKQYDIMEKGIRGGALK